MKHKLNKRGFTLVEMLVTLVIMLLFGTIVTVGINAALKTYEDMTFEANCRMLQDDINTSFGTIVRTSTIIRDYTDEAAAKQDDVDPGIYFKSSHYSGTQNFGRIALDDSKGQLYVYSRIKSTEEITDCALVSPGAYDKMKVKDVTLTYENKTGYAVFSLSYNIYLGDKNNPTYQHDYSCSYKTVNTDKVIKETKKDN